MGLDEALLRDAGSGSTLRFYRWRPAAISLGYFQPSAWVDSVQGSHAVVRRITGGGAIYHDHEITLALTLDATRLPTDTAASYALVHGCVAAALDRLGISTRAASGDPDTAARPARHWCFAEPTTHDLLTTRGDKLFGSAQRRLRHPAERVLHHGSLVLRAPDATPFCGSLLDFAPPEATEDRLIEALIGSFAEQLGLEPRPGEPTASELHHAAILARRYADPKFVRRR
ncbi:MAG: lipoate--protein ligase family protein [Planctomycetes bacterium]|nr:lipoate--protein ligase family protein [Planctomycetota bacterium]MCB9888661.1 lipoate--protein ligase family protein [Planctomycetota bacterium]